MRIVHPFKFQMLRLYRDLMSRPQAVVEEYRQEKLADVAFEDYQKHNIDNIGFA